MRDLTRGPREKAPLLLFESTSILGVCIGGRNGRRVIRVGVGGSIMTHMELPCVGPGSSRGGCWVKPERTMLGEASVRGWWHHLTKCKSHLTEREANLSEAS